MPTIEDLFGYLAITFTPENCKASITDLVHFPHPIGVATNLGDSVCLTGTWLNRRQVPGAWYFGTAFCEPVRSFFACTL
ncbi:MAG: hypothetical protein ACO3LM_06905, partial [Steroidobacteraceae bacterium]